MEIILIFLLIIVLYLILTNIWIVAQAHCFVIERLGRYRTTWQSGIHVKMPFVFINIDIFRHYSLTSSIFAPQQGQ